MTQTVQCKPFEIEEAATKQQKSISSERPGGATGGTREVFSRKRNKTTLSDSPENISERSERFTGKLDA